MPIFNLSDAKPVTLSLADAKPVEAATTPDAAESSWYTPITDFLTQLHSLNPSNIAAGLASTAKLFAPPGQGEMLAASTGPLGLAVARMAPAVAKSQKDLLDQAKTAFDSGDYAAGLRHTLGAIANFVPGMGTRLDEAGGMLGKGEYAKGAGAIVDAAVPMLLSKIPGVGMDGATGAEPGVIALGNRLGVNDAAAITSNRAVRGVQALADNLTLSGSAVAEGARARTVGALTTAADDIASRATGGATPTTPYNAGTSLQSAGRTLKDAFNQSANEAYDSVRKIEALPVNNKIAAFDKDGSPLHEPMPLPVDRRAAKDALSPIYERMAQSMPLARQQNSLLFKALDNVVNGPDYAPLSVTDMDLGALKALARKQGGLAHKAVGVLEDAVDETLNNASPEVRTALDAGRAATKKKYEVVDAMSQYQAEPVAAFKKATMAHDAGYNHLAAIAKVLPNEMPKLGRAYLDDITSKATAGGGFEINDAAWWNLGTRTKQLLYKDPAYIAEVDNFMKLAKRLRTPAGQMRTAYVGGFAVDLLQGMWLHNPGSMVLSEAGGYAVSKLLRSKVGVAALSRGLTVPARSSAAPAIASQISALLNTPDEEQ